MRKRPVVLIIRDGWGVRKEKQGNAVAHASTPVTSELLKKYPFTILQASGEHVGFPKGFQGSSEAGHLNIGAGRIVKQELTIISDTISDGSFFRNQKLVGIAERCKKHNSALHLMGLVQDEGIHAHISHLYALLAFAKKNGIKDVCIHFFSDGRDTNPDRGIEYLSELESNLRRLGIGKVVTISGRYYSMDRDRHWDRIEKAYNAIVRPDRALRITSVKNYIRKCYSGGIGDEFIPPAALQDYNGIKDNDCVIFFNYRQDRAIQLTKAMTEPGFDQFKSEKLDIGFLGFTRYYDEFRNYMIEPLYVKSTLGEVLSRNRLKQVRIAETEKFKHITSFMNGKIEKPFDGEDRILVPSPNVPTYDKKPEMSAAQVALETVKAIKSGKYDVIFVNFANPDMVGHTGKFDAIVKAVEVVDGCVGSVVKETLDTGGVALVTADHGNAEDKTKRFSTSHTTNPVHFIYVADDSGRIRLRKGGVLADMAPTILKLLGIHKPEEMTAEALIL